MSLEAQSEMEGNEGPKDEERDRERLSLNSTDQTVKRNVKRPTTDFETLIHLLKGNIGSGSLAMPQAFMNSGLWTGLAGVPVIGAVECISGGTNITQFEYMCIVLAPVLSDLFFYQIYKYLAPVSMIATASQFIGLIITFYYLVRDLPLVNMKVPAFAGWSTFPLFFRNSDVLPLENNMKHPNHFPGWTGVLISGMIIVVCTYCAIGFYGYLRYGDDVMGSITLNLPGDEGLAQGVKILMSLAIFLTYPLQYYVALSIMLPAVKGTVSSKQAKFIVEYAFRSAIRACCCYPKHRAVYKLGWRSVCFDVINAFISFIGILGFVTGTYSSIVELVNYFEEESHDIETGC
ncbi:hypothetical protein Anas_09351 [Armadillidium nasatum]|uniref:Amino acid transporter transmembrane domain-containing protein n=1 Tax=Armadillidium nasatum TaxID=96803 RepID=A0A5N5SUV3_9CRUS|nr:hypothetical protein Anas_09351 [Armadillidium nasatum]